MYSANGNGFLGSRTTWTRQPLNVYGQTKYEGEIAIEHLLDKYFIVRIAWVFGVSGKEFYQDDAESGKKSR